MLPGLKHGTPWLPCHIRMLLVSSAAVVLAPHACQLPCMICTLCPWRCGSYHGQLPISWHGRQLADTQMATMHDTQAYASH